MRISLLLLLCALVSSSVFAQSPQSTKSGDNLHVLIEATKPYDSLVKKIEKLGGSVQYEYKNIDAIAATLPREKVNQVSGFRETGAILEDRIFLQEEPRQLQRGGLGDVSASVMLDAGEISSAAGRFADVAPSGYYPAEVALTRAGHFWNATGHLGEGVIIGIMDSGLGDVWTLRERIVGGENFVPVTPSLDDGVPAISPNNGSHGTQVATSAGADGAFCFPSEHAWALAFKLYVPDTIIPDGCEPGFDLVFMVGQAPAAEFFALKVFNNQGVTSNSIILAAFDRAIELKAQYDAGSGGVNLRVLNASFGGSTLFAGNDPFFARMIERVNAAGILTVLSAGNNGPSGITGGDPGTARSTLTVGATTVPAYEWVLREIQYASLLGPGVGALYRANDVHQTADFSSRGPTADGRMDPDITAPGFAIFTQGATDGLSLASGTSFSAPIVAGAAALLISAFPDATPDQIRGALLAGANPNVLQDGSGPMDQGHGFLDVLAAYDRFGAQPPRDQGKENKQVRNNVKALGLDVISSTNASRSTGWLLPGQRAEYFVETKATDALLTVQVSVTAELPGNQQNLLFGDDAILAIHGAKTSSIGSTGDYKAFAFVSGGATFTLGPEALEEGLIRVTIMGDWTNAGRVQANVQLATEKSGLAKKKPINGNVSQDELRVHTLDVKPGTSELSLLLDWSADWSEWPTNDLDLFVFDPSGALYTFEGATLNAPERVIIPDPEPGRWTLQVDGFTVWNGKESYQILSSATTGPVAGKTAEAPLTFALDEAYPNPFNPSTTIGFTLPEASAVKVTVYDVMGRLVERLVEGSFEAGQHRITFASSHLPSGTYLYRIEAGAFTQTKRMVLVK